MKYLIRFLVLIISISPLFSQSGSKLNNEQYIQKYKNISIEEMKRSGIPASITLAQGMLESDNGNSRLARSANNHFGIKCHDWKGKTIYQDDDAADECFRKYGSAEESFRDHSDFLMSKQRYGFLFNYKSTDYKNWAKGLKKAGYATDRTYAERLIKIIEENNLHYFDQELTASQRPASHYPAARKRSSDPDFAINLASRPIYQTNNVDYVVVKKGDTYFKLCNELEMLSWELFRYNEITKDSVLHEGQKLYIQPKRRKAAFGTDTHIVKPGETIYSISQLYAIKSKNLLKFNNLAPTDSLKVGQILNLRKKVKS